jgi:hypothetical protein
VYNVSASDERKLLEALRAVRASVEKEPVPQRMEEDLRMAFRREMQVRNGAVTSMPNRRARFGWSWRLAAVAACVAVVAGAALWRTNLERAPKPVVAKEMAEKPAKAPVVETATRVEAPRALPPRAQRKRKPAKPHQVLASRYLGKEHNRSVARVESVQESEPVTGRPQTAMMTEFVAVPYAPPFAPSDRGQLIRLQVPRNAMRRFGIPVSIERWSDRVEADVLLGEDGIARAVRFVK